MSGYIRFVRPEDVHRLLQIYNQSIDTPITFEVTLPSDEEFLQRMTDISRDYPYIVWEDDGCVLGYAYAHRYKERQAYQWGAELSVYIDESAVGKGIGRQLYGTLIQLLKLQNVKTVYGCVTAGNPASDGLHDALGFRQSGTFTRAGFKSGRWHDVYWYEKSIGSYEDQPEPFISIKNVAAQTLDAILRK